MHLDFTGLCDGPTSVGDLLGLADRYRTLVRAYVPPLVHVTPEARRRFGNLVDVVCGHDVRLVVLASGPPAQVLDADLTDHERMRSRPQLLQEA